MKKLLALLLCVASLLTLLAGCGESTDIGDEGGDTNSRKGIKAPEGYTITIGLRADALVDFENNKFIEWLEQASGYNIELVKYASSDADAAAQVATEFMVPDIKMPDMLWGVVNTQPPALNYVDGGLIYNLAPYFNDPEYSQLWWDRLNECEDKEFVEFVEKKLYIEGKDRVVQFPTIERNTYDMIRHQAFINQEWLDKLELPMPTNIDELYDTLVAFRDKDPNGNGKKDEIPLIGKAAAAYGDVTGWIINMFRYYEDSRPWRVDENGKLYGDWWSDEYRKALIFLNKLVKEGLMPDSVFTISGDEITSLVNPYNGVETVGIWLAHPAGVALQGSECVNVYKAMPHWGYAVMDAPRTSWDGAVITTDCEYPDACWEILMLMTSKEGSYRMRYGEKGVDWIDATPGSKAFTGLDAEINILNDAWGGETDSTFRRVHATISFANENERSELSDKTDAWTKAKLTMMGECYRNNWTRYEEQGGRPKDVVMPLIYTAEEESEASMYRNNVNNWFKTARANFIKGVGEFNDPSNDAQWKAYVDGFKNNNYEDWLLIAQDVYDYTYGSKSGK